MISTFLQIKCATCKSWRQFTFTININYSLYYQRIYFCGEKLLLNKWTQLNYQNSHWSVIPTLIKALYAIFSPAQIDLTPTSLLKPASLREAVFLPLLSTVSCSTVIHSCSLLEEKDEKIALVFGSWEVSSACAWMSFPDYYIHEVIWPMFFFFFFIGYMSWNYQRV